MKIYYLVKANLHSYPPCMSQIRSIKKLGYDIEVWYGSSDNVAVEILNKERIKSAQLMVNKPKTVGLLSTLVNWITYRSEVIKKLKELDTDDLLWFGTTESALPLLGALKKYKYVSTSLELNDDNFLKKYLYKYIARNASAIVACELSRAYIMRFWYDLNKIPYVMPNKPFELQIDQKSKGSIESSRKAIDEIGEKEFIIYQGIFQNTDAVLEIAAALRDMESKYYLVLMGTNYHDTRIIEKLKKVYDKVLFFESIPAPKHLEVTSHAHIGIVFYDGMTLNKAFCAPNKIYEYSYFGLPCLSNRIPGLVNTVEAFRFGRCIDMKKEEIISAINDIEDNYEEYSLNGKVFYNATDNIAVMRKLLTDIGC